MTPLRTEDAAIVAASLRDVPENKRAELVTIHEGCLMRARRRLENLDRERDATLRAIAMRERALLLLAVPVEDTPASTRCPWYAPTADGDECAVCHDDDGLCPDVIGLNVPVEETP